jgi:mycothiol synthase
MAAGGPDVHRELLRALPPGGVLWLRAGGKSLWPLLRDGDSLRVERCTEADLAPGDVAVVAFPDGRLVAHLVETVAPLRTASSVGVRDPLPLEALGRVTGFRRAGRTWPWPRDLRRLLWLAPTTARLAKALPGARALVRRLRDER